MNAPGATERRNATPKRETTIEGIWKEYRYRLLQYFLHLPGVSFESAEDLLQETILKVQRSLASWNPARPLAPWLYAVARNAWHDWKRSMRRRPATVPWPEDAADKPGREAWPVQPDARNEEYTAIRIFLESLSGLDREIALLRYSEDFSVDQIAAVIRRAPGTVKYRLFGIRERFKKYWEEGNE